MPNLTKISQTVVVISHLTFFKMEASAILELSGKFWDDTQREFSGVYHLKTFSWNRISRFDNTKV